MKNTRGGEPLPLPRDKVKLLYTDIVTKWENELDDGGYVEDATACKLGVLDVIRGHHYIYGGADEANGSSSTANVVKEEKAQGPARV